MRFKARLSQWHQRTVLTIRWWFRLPIDDLMDIERKEVLRITGECAESMKTLLQLTQELAKRSSNLQGRLAYYEKHIPRMRELRRQYDREQQALQQQVSSTQTEMKERLEHGIVGAIS